ncbi:MAG: IS1595 family transposase [Bacteroidales bacterium]|nr:IS1595 family transposase [Bacteroidales bacterium]
MKTIVNDLEGYLSMGKQEHLLFLDQLYILMNKINADAVDYQTLKAKSTPPLCPECDSRHIVKNGTQNNQQVYLCKECGRSFRDSTGTFVYKIHKREKMLDYIRCMLEGKTLRACAAEVGISLPTSFAWRHRIITALRSFEDNINFFGVVESDELLMQYSEKGRKYKNIKERIEANKKKKKKVAILATQDRSGNMLFKQFGLDKVKRVEVEQLLKDKVSGNSVLCIGNNVEFRKLRTNDLKKQQIIVNNDRQDGLYSLSIIQKHKSIFKYWINNKFRGVATKYLQSYIMWYVIAHKYLLKQTIADIGRMLNLASSDRRAWYKYKYLREIKAIF